MLKPVEPLKETDGVTHVSVDPFVDNIFPVDPAVETLIDEVNNEGVVIEFDVIVDPVFPFVITNVVFG
jgi:hypothetical protein